jgi:septal ring-binding cell division protein DamX
MMFRLRAAGYRGPDIFSPAAVRMLARASQGLTRRINILADKSLLAAFSQNTHQVTAKHMRAAIRDSEFHRAGRSSPLAWIVAAAVAAGIVIGGLGLRFLGSSPAPATAAAPPATAAAPSTAAAAPAPGANAMPAPTSISVPAAPAAITPIAAPAEHPASGPITTAPHDHVSEPAARPVQDNARVTRTAAENTPAATGALTRLRLAATENWLKNAPGGAYTIQVMALAPGNERELEVFLNRADKLTGLNDIYLYQTRIKGQTRPGLAVVYGSYNTPEKGRQAMAGLPEELRSHLPYLRTVAGIRREIAEPDLKATPVS